jgi:hypothetical protein
VYTAAGRKKSSRMFFRRFFMPESFEKSQSYDWIKPLVWCCVIKKWSSVLKNLLAPVVRPGKKVLGMTHILLYVLPVQGLILGVREIR